MCAIFTAGYKAVLHVHSVVEECEIVELLEQIDPKTRKPIKKKVLFVKNGAIVLCRVQVENAPKGHTVHHFVANQAIPMTNCCPMVTVTTFIYHEAVCHDLGGFTVDPFREPVLFVNNVICVEKFSDFPQLGRFTLRTEGKTVAVGKITAI
ncbi:eukaryotic peptide chain release factor GTP-binding subunit erf3a-like protein [Trifolium pratense]|uniref:Eukaryotic peptide chain release factor GTP-binding subunit erf3a-like protein n=1 Tax=Trifolium pratense TaxID=57577 RepID=A0A2K3MZ84_TRIPR|nr:eukaryotic peptide chain release factor GTP-binding subunit erf3a-like protein [Trifolium pratense]